MDEKDDDTDTECKAQDEVSASAKEKIIEAVFSDPLMKDMISGVMKKKWIDQYLIDGLNRQDMILLAKTIMNSSSIWATEELEYYLNKKEVRETYERIQCDFEKESVSSDLQELYAENIAQIREEVDQRQDELRREILGDKYEQIESLKDSNKENKADIVARIEEDHRHSTNEIYWNKIKQLENVHSYIEQFPYTEQDTKTTPPAVSGDENRFLKHCAIRIHYPKLYTNLHTYEPEYDDYPLKWLSLSAPENRLAYQMYKKDDIPDDLIINRVDNEGFSRDFLDTARKLPPYRSRMDLLEEVTDNYSDGRYASVINILLPQIEHLMWRYAVYLDARHEENIIVDADYDDFWDFDPRDYQHLKLRNKSGAAMENVVIGDLVEKTALSEYLHPHIVEYFGQELFSDRNPILHGNSDDYYSKLEASKKMIFFHNVATELVNTVSERFAEEFSNTETFSDLNVPFELMGNQIDEE